MTTSPGIYLGKGQHPQNLLLRRANRHGLIAGATGTGKTTSLRVLAEGFSGAGVPVFMADVKGDLTGLCQPGEDGTGQVERARAVDLKGYAFRRFPVILWDIYGKRGHPVRVTVAGVGPLLLARMLALNEVQEGILNAAFALAEDEGLLLLDLKDLRAVLNYMAGRARALRERYGNISTQSVGAILRRLLGLEQQGAGDFFGEPDLAIEDFIRRDRDGLGYINILVADRLIQHGPRLYSSFLFWLLSSLFQRLPEVGDTEKPRLAFFFDEAHLLFDDASRTLAQKVEQVVRLIRSKGVGVYLVTQSPLDVPENVLGQLGNRLQHALRAFTPRDQRAVRAAAQTFRANPAFDAAEAIQQLVVGEALVSVLDGQGAPTVVERALMAPPASRLGPASEDERQRALDESPVLGKYEQPVHRQSAYECLQVRREAEAREAARLAEQAARRKQQARNQGETGKGRQQHSALEAIARSAARSFGTSLGRQIVRGIVRWMSRMGRDS